MKQNLKAEVLGMEFTWTVDLGSASALVVAAARQGLQKWLTDAGSTVKPTDAQCEADPRLADPGKPKTQQNREYLEAMEPIRKAAINDRWARIKDGSYKPGSGGGGGSRQGPESRAWIDFFKAEDHKEGGKPVCGKTLQAAQRTYCRQALIAQHAPGTPERVEVEQNIGKHLEERFGDWKAAMEANHPKIKLGIEYYKAQNAEVVINF